MRESGLDRTERGLEMLVSIKSELSVFVVSEDQQAAFLWERQRVVPSRNQGLVLSKK